MIIDSVYWKEHLVVHVFLLMNAVYSHSYETLRGFKLVQ